MITNWEYVCSPSTITLTGRCQSLGLQILNEESTFQIRSVFRVLVSSGAHEILRLSAFCNAPSPFLFCHLDWGNVMFRSEKCLNTIQICSAPGSRLFHGAIYPYPRRIEEISPSIQIRECSVLGRMLRLTTACWDRGLPIDGTLWAKCRLADGKSSSSPC